MPNKYLYGWKFYLNYGQGWELDEIGLENEMQHQLVQMNDDGSSFETIADFIEEKL